MNTVGEKLTHSTLHVRVLRVAVSARVSRLADDIRNFFHSFRLRIVGHRRDSAANVPLKICMVHCLHSTSPNQLMVTVINQ